MTLVVDKSDYAAAAAMCGRVEPVAKSLAYFLPREKADGVLAVVAGCRLVRDTICETASGGGKSGECCGGSAGIVDLVRSQMENVFDGKLELPNAEFRDESQHVLAAFASTVRRFEVPRGMVMELVEGSRDDLATVRYATWNSLRRHCERVGGSVASMLACVLGATNSDAGKFAVELGAAGRLISIVDSVSRDLERGRIYLPMEDLARCRVSERELLRVAASGEPADRNPQALKDSRVSDVVAVELERVRGMIATASEGVCWLAGDGSRMAASMVIEVFLRQVSQLSRGLRVDAPSKLALVRMLPRAARLARRFSDERVGASR